MKVRELIQALQNLGPGAQELPVALSVGWADDTAISDHDEDVRVKRNEAVVSRPAEVVIDGWLSNTAGSLETGYEDED